MIVEVRNKIVGKTNKDISIPNLAIELLNEKISVSELIKETVSEVIDYISQDLGYDITQVKTVLNRQYLSEASIKEQAQNGEIKLTQVEKPDTPYINKKSEIRNACQAFENGTYIIVVDGKQAESLDQILHLTPTSKISFVRITPLVGG